MLADEADLGVEWPWSTWTLLTSQATFSPRSAFGLTTVTDHNVHGAPSLPILVGGMGATITDLNDVWEVAAAPPPTPTPSPSPAPTPRPPSHKLPVYAWVLIAAAATIVVVVVSGTVVVLKRRSRAFDLQNPLTGDHS
mmetsp:Transcript_15581/g.37179  ORF Transcript_15581/g.37179 Transcript_15581/m.37179 type:complete len:138 (+) Transcript_15581:1-414(+)